MAQILHVLQGCTGDTVLPSPWGFSPDSKAETSFGAAEAKGQECRKEAILGLTLSRRLGPSAKKLYLTSPDDRVSTTVTLAPSVDRNAFQEDVGRHHGTVRSWLPEANIASVDIDAGCLGELADIDGVVYIEAGQIYRP